MAAWSYLENGGRHAELIWHRRSGKDDICLNYTATAIFKRVGTYWHLLPEASQARKAIWTAVNPHTGIRRIDEAFPQELRANTQDKEMMIRFKNGSTWQVLGSDNYNSLVGSPPVGAVFSEWGLANPSARAYIRPIFAENNGWQVYITTPRGKNHAFRTYHAARKEPGAFAQILDVTKTKAISQELLDSELKAYMADWGADQGMALYEQEYMCSFDAAVLGTFYGKEMREVRNTNRITDVPYDPKFKVFTAWDVGWTDDTTIVFWQNVGKKIHIIDHFAASGLKPDDYFDVVESKGYVYEKHWLPHDARARTFASEGKSIEEKFIHRFGGDKIAITPNLSIQDGILQLRSIFDRLYFDEENCHKHGLIDCIDHYQRKWDDEKRIFSNAALHDWASHSADAMRYMSIAHSEERLEKPKEPAKYWNQQTLEELWKSTPKKKNRI